MSSKTSPMVDVLIGSPRDSFWETVQLVLKGYYPYKLKHVRSIDEILENTDAEFRPVLALIDAQDGSTVANEWVQSTKMTYECPVIVLHSAAAPLNFDLVKKNGANEIMHLNFDREFISDMILQLAPIEMEGDQIPITSLMPVDMRDIEPSMNVNFDVYAHLPANHRSVLLRKSGDIIDERQVEKFKNLKQQMYVKKTQMKQFFEYARTIMSMRNVAFPVSMTEKFHRSKKAIYQIMTEFLNGTGGDYSEGKIILEKCREILAEFDLTKDLSPEDLTAEICRFTGNLRTNYHDCICMSAYGAYFAQLLGWDQAKREAAALSGLLHNIGLSQMPPQAADKLFADMNEEEKNEYRRYPDRSVIMVKAKKVPLPQEVADGIAQHRELGSGQGFPKKLIAKDISEMGKLMALAYSFHEMTALRPGRPASPPAVALTHLRDTAMEGSGDYDLVMATQIFKKFKI
ncbi:hypothetical protein D3C87_189760 [compost metagenome]